MRQPVFIRDLHPNETDVLREFLYQAIHIPPGVEPPPRSIVEKLELQLYIKDFGTQRHDHGLAAIHDEKVIGACWVRDMPDYGHMEDGVPSFAISVLPDWRGMGIGSKLMQAMLDKLHELGCSKASLSVQKTNPAYRLYKRLGFQTVAETREEYLMVYCMEKENHNGSVYDR